MTPRRVIVLLLLFTLLIVTCILIGVSVSTIPYNNIALVQDEINPKIWEKVYGSGRHFIGVGRRFHTFPLNLQLIDFSWFTRSDSYGDDFYDASELRGRTYDGLAVTVAVTVFSRIRKNESRDLYLELCYSSSMDSASLIGGEFSCADKANSLAAMHLRAILVNVIALTETEVFFRDRARLSEDMASAVSCLQPPRSRPATYPRPHPSPHTHTRQPQPQLADPAMHARAKKRRRSSRSTLCTWTSSSFRCASSSLTRRSTTRSRRRS